MNMASRRLVVGGLLVALGLGTGRVDGAPQQASPPARTIALTFDDLPVGGSVPRAHRALVFKRLLASLTALHVPAIGFVNERQLYVDDALDSTEVGLLRAWLDAGLELGNHSYSHFDLHRVPSSAFVRDVFRGEEVTRALLAERGRKPVFFRHPYLHTGRTLEIRDRVQDSLARHGYRVAPVTDDNSDWIFAHAYERALGRKSRRAMRRVANAYVPYMERKLAYWERQSVHLFDREIPQILLLHSNRLNGDRLEALVGMLRRRGYTLITVEEALKDSIFRLPDTYDGPAGISWLHRWAITRGPGNVLPDEPKTPEFVLREAGVELE
jgi:peptidoglycan/xylan/chitin deacetylase (PgdA/CDA1 family)